MEKYSDKWIWNEEYDCWCLENILYTAVPTTPEFQQLSIFVPGKLVNEDGSFKEEAKNAPVVFANNAAGYRQMPHVRLGDPRCSAQQYMEHGLIYVTAGCRGRESVDTSGKLIKGPCSLVDLKTAIRFLRHNRAVLPGDWDRIISVGWSAGGACSTLLAVTGNNRNYLPYLEANGAYMDERDDVFAAQIYCPIVDLEHADIAYEWMFGADKECEDSHAGAAETMTPFKEALSKVLAQYYVAYFNSLELHDPDTGEILRLGEDGRSGSGYAYLMNCLNRSAADYFTRLLEGKLSQQHTVEAYLNTKPWLTWDGKRAQISDLDTYVLNHRRRMKPCTSFDKLEMDSGENQLFGTPENDYVHFAPQIADAIQTLKDDYPEEYERHYPAYRSVETDSALAERVRLLNPLSFIGTAEKSDQAKYYRIRVGGSDADTSLSVSMMLALKLQDAKCGNVDYALVWDQPHSQADYPGEILEWIDSICK